MVWAEPAAVDEAGDFTRGGKKNGGSALTFLDFVREEEEIGLGQLDFFVSLDVVQHFGGCPSPGRAFGRCRRCGFFSGCRAVEMIASPETTRFEASSRITRRGIFLQTDWARHAKQRHRASSQCR